MRHYFIVYKYIIVVAKARHRNFAAGNGRKILVYHKSYIGDAASAPAFDFLIIQPVAAAVREYQLVGSVAFEHGVFGGRHKAHHLAYSRRKRDVCFHIKRFRGLFAAYVSVRSARDFYAVALYFVTLTE